MAASLPELVGLLEVLQSARANAVLSSHCLSSVYHVLNRNLIEYNSTQILDWADKQEDDSYYQRGGLSLYARRMRL